VAVALEQSRGAVIGMWSKYAHLILFPVHPKTLASRVQKMIKARRPPPADVPGGRIARNGSCHIDRGARSSLAKDRKPGRYQKESPAFCSVSCSGTLIW
jgi:hypothetical protein